MRGHIFSVMLLHLKISLSKRVNPNDAGFYSCVAGNILGETVSRLGSPIINVNDYPHLTPFEVILSHSAYLSSSSMLSDTFTPLDHLPF